MRAGKAVFVEKPLAIDEAQLARVAEAVTESGNDRLMVGFNRRFAPLLVSLKQLWGERIGPHVVGVRSELDCEVDATGALVAVRLRRLD